MKARSYILFLLLTAAFSLHGGRKGGNMLYAQDTISEQQEITQSIQYADDYLKHRTASLEKALGQNAGIQKRLLRRLSHIEHGLRVKQDSLLQTRYYRHSIDFDSLQKLAANPSTLYNKGSPKANKLIDSLKGIQSFVQKQSGRLQQAADLTSTAGIPGNYSEKLNQLQQQLNAQQQLQKLIEQRSKTLQNLFPGKKMKALGRMQKQIAIAKAKSQSWKQLANDPDAAEEKAYEYLQGIKGFHNYLNTDDEKAFSGLGNHATVADLQRMGYQTKGMVSKSLQEKFGDNLDKVQQQMAKQLQAYQEKINKATAKAKEAKSLYSDTKNQALKLKNTLKSEKPAFRNPLRGVPFLLRWQSRYDFQTSRAMDSRPAMLNLSAGLAYKQTPRLKMGLGIATDIGLGRDWQHLKLSYEGISLRAFADYELILGIALEGGYKHVFRPANRPYMEGYGDKENTTATNKDMIQKAFGSRQQAAYLGLMKSYRINSKWNGTFMLGYNFLWQQYGLRTPLVIRIGWEQ